MKSLFITYILFCSTQIYAQETYVPDDNFEAYLEANGMGNSIPNDDYVTTSNINSVTSLWVNSLNISDLTGIEGFSSLIYLECEQNNLSTLDVSQNLVLEHLDFDNNNINSIDVSQNIALTDLYFGFNSISSLDISQNTQLYSLLCYNNQLTSLDVSQNALLGELHCSDNSLSSLDVSQNMALETIICHNNFIVSLDISQNPLVNRLWCQNNQLTCLNVKNGNNVNLWDFHAQDNPSLYCIEVDNATWSTTNWIDVDAQASFSINCFNDCSVGISEFSMEEHKDIMKIIDFMGRETNDTLNKPLIYMYSDGTTKKVFRVDE